jgi:hypothetical protein
LSLLFKHCFSVLFGVIAFNIITKATKINQKSNYMIDFDKTYILDGYLQAKA